MRNLARGNPARWWRSRSCGSASRAPKALFISPFRRWSTRGLLAFLLLFILAIWYVTNPARIARLSSTLLSRVLGGQVHVQSGRLSLAGTLILSNVEVRAADDSPTDPPIFTAEQIEARFDWFSLLSGQLSATQLVALSPVFQPVEDADSGHWNYERLHPGFGGGPPTPTAKGLTLPVVVLRDARVKWSESRNGRVHQTSETIINGEMTPEPRHNTTYHFRFAQVPAAPTAAGSPAPPGAIFRGTWDSVDSAFQSTTENVVMTESLRNSLPRVARQWCAERQLTGRLSRLDLSFNPRTGLIVTVNFDSVAMTWMIQPEQGIGLAEERPVYPLPLQNVRGQIVFSRNQTPVTQPASLPGNNPALPREPNIIRINDLRGTVLGYQFVFGGQMQGASADAPFNFNLRFPNAVVGDQYPPLFMASRSSQDLIQRMAPHGRMDIAVNLHRDVPRDPVLYTGQVDLHDARLRYAYFPVPLHHVNGRLTFDHRAVTFHDLAAKADESDVRISGTCGTVWSNRFVDVTVKVANLHIDDRLAACLPTQYLAVWNLFSLRGHGNLDVHVTRSDSIRDRQKMVVDFDLLDAQGFLRAVPYPFTHATAHLHIDDAETRIEHLTARTGADGSGRVTIDGVVRYSADDVTALRPELRVLADVPIDQTLLHAFPESLTDHLHDLSLSGRLAYDGTVRRGADPTAPAVQFAGNLAWKQGSLQTQFGDQPLALSAVNAQAVIAPTTLDLKDLSATLDLGDQKIQTQLAGKFDFANSFGGLVKLSLTGKSLALAPAAPPIFPSAWRETWKQFAPSGLVDLSADAALRVNLPPNPDTQPALVFSDALAIDSYTLRLALRDLSLQPPGLPESLSKLTGKIEIVPHTLTMTGMSASLANIALAWDGQADPNTGKISLSGKADTKGYSPTWTRYLPDTIAQYLDPKRDDITLSLRLDSLSREAADKPWAAQGKLQATNLAGTGPVPITMQQADFTGKALFDPKDAGFDFAGTMNAARLTVSDRYLDSLSARLAANAQTHDITFTDIDGKVAGGTLQGNIRVRTLGQTATSQPAAAATPTTLPLPATTPAGLAALPPEVLAQGGFVANLLIHDADISRLVLSDKASDDDRQKVGTGRVTASLSLQESFGNRPDRTGRGDLIVRDGVIYNVPLSMGLMQVATLRLPIARAFQYAETSYYLRNNDITFERILLESNGINLAGLGTVAIDTRKIDMSFITESQREGAVPLITPVIDTFRRNLLELSVTGTLDTPKITPVPLSPVSDFLRSLFPKPRASR